MRDNQKGFSLMEVSIILALMGLLMLVIVPNTDMVFRQKGKKIGSTFVLELEKQRSRAKSYSDQHYYIQLAGTPEVIGGDNTYPTYQIGSEPSGVDTVEKISTEVNKNITIKLTDSSGTSMNDDKIYFNTLGRLCSDSAGTSEISEVHLYVYIKDKQKYKITINGITGNVKWD